jgi:hypothetical protein
MPLSIHFLFRELPKSTNNKHNYQRTPPLSNKGDKSFFFFIIKSGKLELTITYQYQMPNI